MREVKEIECQVIPNDGAGSGHNLNPVYGRVKTPKDLTMEDLLELGIHQWSFILSDGAVCFFMGLGGGFIGSMLGHFIFDKLFM